MGLPDIIDILTGQDDARIRTNERALVLVSELSSDRHKSLYEFVERAGIVITITGLGLFYRKLVVLTGERADSRDLVGTLKTLAEDPKNQKIDCITYVHGEQGKIHFHDGAISSATLGHQIADLRIGNKLRAYYTTACFGSTHAKDMVNAGFNCAAGAVGVNANSAVETPEFITLWATGSSFQDCIVNSRNRALSKPFEDAARRMGFDDVNSDKEVYGRAPGRLRITTNA